MGKRWAGLVTRPIIADHALMPVSAGIHSRCGILDTGSRPWDVQLTAGVHAWLAVVAHAKQPAPVGLGR